MTGQGLSFHFNLYSFSAGLLSSFYCISYSFPGNGLKHHKNNFLPQASLLLMKVTQYDQSKSLNKQLT